MFAKLFAFSTLLAILAAATPAPAPAGSPSESCSTGSIQCCQSVEAANSPAAAALLASIGVVVQDITTPIGITCSPVSVVGVGGSDACSASTVCCEDNAFGGLVSIGCVPVVV